MDLEVKKAAAREGEVRGREESSRGSPCLPNVLSFVGT